VKTKNKLLILKNINKKQEKLARKDEEKWEKL